MTGVGLALGACAHAGAPAHSGGGRLDVHQHMIPPVYAHWLADRGVRVSAGRPLPDWSVEAALAQMDLIGTAKAFLSVSTPGLAPARDAADAAAMARAVNDFGAQVVKDHPGRFGLFATVPMTDVKTAVHETVRAFDVLKADGLIMLAHDHGTYLGQRSQADLFAELDARQAVVLIHPDTLPGPAVPDVPPLAADFLLDTSRAAYLLVRNGIIGQYPHIRFVLSHGGGFVPYAAHRMAVSIVGETGRLLTAVLDDVHRFYVDTALSGSPAALPSLLAFVGDDHVLFGSDWPFAPQAVVQYFTAGLDTYRRDDRALHDAIDHGTAAGLMPGVTRYDDAWRG
jgi:predicted TIM-barrel fold metal-dependent hydrolase